MWTGLSTPSVGLTPAGNVRASQFISIHPAQLFFLSFILPLARMPMLNIRKYHSKYHFFIPECSCLSSLVAALQQFTFNFSFGKCRRGGRFFPEHSWVFSTDAGLYFVSLFGCAKAVATRLWWVQLLAVGGVCLLYVYCIHRVSSLCCTQNFSSQFLQNFAIRSGQHHVSFHSGSADVTCNLCSSILGWVLV